MVEQSIIKFLTRAKHALDHILTTSTYELINEVNAGIQLFSIICIEHLVLQVLLEFGNFLELNWSVNTMTLADDEA